MGRAGRAGQGLREGVPWSESLVLAPLKIYLFVLLEVASRKNEDKACGSLVESPPLKICFCFSLQLGLGSWPRLAHAGPHQRGHRSGLQCCEGPRGGGPEAGQQAGSTKGLEPEGGGELAPHQLASCKAGGITGKELSPAECQGRRSRRTEGRRCGSGLLRPPGMLGGGPGPGPASLWPSPRCPGPQPPARGEEAAGEAGAPGPPEGAWASAWPSRWLGRRPAGPSPAP